MEDSLVGESQAHGLAEGAVKEVKGAIGSLQWAAEQVHRVKLDSASRIVPWCVRHAGSMMSRARLGLAGRTACELRKGKLHRKRT